MEDKSKPEDRNKGLTDKHDGDLILNESGTSVRIDRLEEDSNPDEEQDILNTADEDEAKNMDKGMSQSPYDIHDPH
jgi:hypothetical protein